MISLRPQFALTVAAVSLLSLAACNTTRSTQSVPGVGVTTTVDPALATKAPVDIAILPIANLTGGEAPVDDLRVAFQRGLVVRNYSPLAFGYVDRNITEASYTPGAAQEQGVLSIELQRWDTRLWETHHTIEVTMRARLLDATSGGNELWKAEASRRYEFGAAFDRLPTDSARLKLACETIAAEFLERLPPRRANQL